MSVPTDISPASALSKPVSWRPAPSRGAAFISSITRIEPFGETSAMICRIEFDPMSIAAIRTAWRSPPVAGSVFEVMLDLLAFCNVNSVLGDVGRKVGHPLEIAAHKEQLE